MKGDTEVVLLIIVGLGMFLMGNTLALDRLPFWLMYLVPAIATVFAAFFGANVAFKLQKQRETAEARRSAAVAGNRIIFNLIRAYNQFHSIYTTFIKPHERSPYRAFEILPSEGGLGGYVSSPTDDISVLFDSSSPNLAGEIARLDMEIQATLDAIATRTRVHVQMQELLGRAKLREDQILSEEQISEIAGTALPRQLKVLTEEVITSVKSVLGNSRELIPRVSTELRTMYPELTILSIKEVEENTQADAG